MKKTTDLKQNANTWWNSLSGWKQCVLLDKYQPIINGLLMTDEHKEQIYLKETASSNDSLQLTVRNNEILEGKTKFAWCKDVPTANLIFEALNNYNALKQSNKELIEALESIVDRAEMRFPHFEKDAGLETLNKAKATLQKVKQ